MCREEDDKLAFMEYLTNKRAYATEKLTNDNYDQHLLALVSGNL